MANYQTFYEDLKNAKEESFGKIIKFRDDGLNPGGFDHFSNIMYVRDAYLDLKELIVESVTRKKKRSILVTGSPGIGKTMFSAYLMREAIQMGYNILYCKSKTALLYFHSNGFEIIENEAKAMRKIVNSRTTKRKSTIMFVNLMEVSEPPQIDNCLCTIVTSSPNRARYKYFSKRPTFAKFVMPQWTVSEIIEYFDLVVSRSCKDPAATRLKVENQLEIYGPNPKYVFEFNDSTEMDEALRAKGLIVARLMFFGETFEPVEDSEGSHMITPMFTDPESHYQSYELRIASEYVLRKLWAVHKETIMQSMTATITYGDALMKGLAGDMFSFVCSRFYLAKKVHEVNRLVSGTRTYGKTKNNIGVSISPNPANTGDDPDSFVLDCGPWVKLTSNSFKNGSDFVIEDGFIYEQCNRNTHSIDSFLVHRDSVIFFQATVSPDHKIGGDGVSRMVTIIESNLRREMTTIKFVFVVPHSRTQLNTIQPLTTTHKKNYASLAAIPYNIRHIATVQYVVALNIEAHREDVLTMNF